jgi:Protein of unknown function (DUF3558)
MTGGTPGLTSTTGAASTSSPSPTDAPTVANPLDTTKWQANPCSVLTQAQLTSILPNGQAKAGSSSLGPDCSWHDLANAEKTPGLGVGFVTANKSGLSSLYENHKNGAMAILNRLPDIDGYPAVVYSNDPGAIQDGACSIAVGVTNQLTISADVNMPTGGDKSKACDTAIKLATSAMDTMTGKS